MRNLLNGVESAADGYEVPVMARKGGEEIGCWCICVNFSIKPDCLLFNRSESF